MVSVTVYDGAETIGGNKIYVEDGGSGIFLDFGMNFARYNAYFNEFLCSRDTRGIHDLLRLNLIPKLNIYREDLLTDDISGQVRSFSKPDVKAILLSHAHLDHSGNMGLINREIPIVASNVSLALLKAQIDVSKSGISSEIAYTSPRETCSDGYQCKSIRSSPNLGRDLYSLNDTNENLMTLMLSNPLVSKKFNPGTIGNCDQLDLPFDIDHYNMDHSIYGAVAYKLHSESGTIVYTGDFRLHGTRENEVSRLITDAKSANILIVEGTRVGRDGDLPSTERTVYDSCKAAVDQTTGLVIADFSAKNFERLEIFSQIARESGRDLIITSRDLYMLYALECADGICRTNGLLVYKEVSDNKSHCETELINERYNGMLITPKQISEDPGRYILCFSFYDMKHLLDIVPGNCSYIYSSSEAYSEEQEIDHLKLFNWLKYFNTTTYGIQLHKETGNICVSTEPGYHASGHISAIELEKFIDRIDPDVIIPVHTTNPEWFKDNFHDSVQILKDCQRYSYN